MKLLYTIGYEGSSISDFLSALETAKIDLLIDVRDVPISRKRGFSKSALSNSLAQHDIGYLHLKGLGDPKPGRIAAREGRYADFQQIFCEHLRSSIAQSDVKRSIEAATEAIACLLCFERDYTNCHRLLIAKEMARLGGFRVIHLAVPPKSERKVIKGGISARDGAFALGG